MRRNNLYNNITIMKKALYVTTGIIVWAVLATGIAWYAATGWTLSHITDKVRGEIVELDYNTVPESIRNYVATNYTWATVERTKEDDGWIEVELTNGTDLIFETDWSFREIEKKHWKKKGKWKHKHHDFDRDKDDINLDDIPQNIKDYVSTNYSWLTIEEAEKEEDGSIEVELSDDTELIFNADGTFKEIETQER